MQKNSTEYTREELTAELTALEEKLATPKRTVEDIVRHMQLIKQLKDYN